MYTFGRGSDPKTGKKPGHFRHEGSQKEAPLFTSSQFAGNEPVDEILRKTPDFLNGWNLKIIQLKIETHLLNLRLLGFKMCFFSVVVPSFGDHFMHKPLNKDPVIFTNHELVVEPTHLENMLVKFWILSPRIRGEKKRHLKPPPRT